MTLFDCDFQALPDGAGWAVESFKRAAASSDGPTYSIVGGFGRLQTGTNTGYNSWIIVQPLSYLTDDFDLHFTARIPGTGTFYPRVHFRAQEPSGVDGNALPGDCYYLGLGNAGLGLARRQSSTATTLAVQSATYTAGQLQRVRLRVAGASIRARTWADGATEPTAWPIDVTDSTLPVKGKTGFGIGGGSTARATVEFGRITITALPPAVTWWD